MKLAELDSTNGLKRSELIGDALEVLGIPTEGSEWVFVSKEDERWDIWGATAFGLVVVSHEVHHIDAAHSTVSVKELVPWSEIGPIAIETITDRRPELGFATSVTATIRGMNLKATRGRGEKDRDGVLGFVAGCLAFRHEDGG